MHDVTKQYPNGKLALRDVDLVIPEGDFVFLVGPSGAGKSTLIKLLIRDELATQGAVVLDGQDLARLPRRHVPRMRRKIGIIFQDFKLLPTKTVWENVAFALEVTGTPQRKIRPAVDRVLALVGLTAQAKQIPRSCRAASSSGRPSPAPSSTTPGSSSPTSRPATSTRSSAGRSCSCCCASTSSGVTVLMATHNAEVVTALRRRVVALEEGRIIRDEVGGAYHRED